MSVETKGRKEIAKRNMALERLVVEYVPIEWIKPNAYNPNRQSEHDFALLMKSITEDGFTQPVICLQDGTVVDGEHRWRAARELKMTEIPVVKVEMTPEQMRIATLRHNRARGSEDIELAAQVIRDLQQLGALEWAQDSLEMSDIEVNRLIEDFDAPSALANDEFNDGWEPVSADPAQVKNESDGQRASGISAAASDALRQREKRMLEARSAEDVAAVRRDTSVYRLFVIFSGEEGEIVRKALGDKPADSVLRLCKAALEVIN